MLSYHNTKEYEFIQSLNIAQEACINSFSEIFEKCNTDFYVFNTIQSIFKWLDELLSSSKSNILKHALIWNQTRNKSDEGLSTFKINESKEHRIIAQKSTYEVMKEIDDDLDLFIF